MSGRLGLLLLAVGVAAGGCTCERGASPGPPPPPVASASSTAVTAATSCPSAEEVAPGLVVERALASADAPIDAGDGCLTLVRIDPARYRFRLLTALADGGSQPVTRWAARLHLTGVTNASMFQKSLRSTTLLVSDGVVNNGDDNAKFGGFMAFDPTEPGLARVAFFGRDCPGFDLARIRRQYRSIVQNYRMLDCDGRAIPWRDEKVYSAAAIGMDRAGRVVFVHTRTPFSMTGLGAMLASPTLGMRAALFVEGGPEASLYVSAAGWRLEAMGSYETGFVEDDRNDHFWDLPNVLGFSPL